MEQMNQEIFTDSQNLPRFFDELDPCAEIEKQKSSLPTKTDSLIISPQTPRSSAQIKQCRKDLSAPKKKHDRCAKNETPEERQNDTKRISPPFRIRSGLRSNSLETNNLLRSNEDDIISNKGTPRRKIRKMRKKRKNVNELKKCNSTEIIYNPSQSDEMVIEMPKKITCSLPLERLSGFLETILLTSHLSESEGKIASNNVNNSSNNHNGSNDTSDHSSHLIKSLCLYCDKKFSSQKVRIKHTERVHAISKGRRLSSRNSTFCSSSLFSFPGCSYCCYSNNKLKSVNVSEDLKSLFYHLVDFHADRYFACKICAIRFANPEDLENHIDDKHKVGTNSNNRNLSSKKVKGKSSSLDNILSGELSKSGQLLNADTSSSDKISSLGDDASNDPESTPTKTRRQLKQAMENKPLTTRSCQNILRGDEAILSRLGIAQNRLPRGRKGIRNRRLCNLESAKSEAISNMKTRSKVGRVVTSNIPDPVEMIP